MSISPFSTIVATALIWEAKRLASVGLRQCLFEFAVRSPEELDVVVLVEVGGSVDGSKFAAGSLPVCVNPGPALIGMKLLVGSNGSAMALGNPRPGAIASRIARAALSASLSARLFLALTAHPFARPGRVAVGVGSHT
jgi:hypothetical protein